MKAGLVNTLTHPNLVRDGNKIHTPSDGKNLQA